MNTKDKNPIYGTDDLALGIGAGVVGHKSINPIKSMVGNTAHSLLNYGNKIGEKYDLTNEGISKIIKANNGNTKGLTIVRSPTDIPDDKIRKFILDNYGKMKNLSKPQMDEIIQNAKKQIKPASAYYPGYNTIVDSSRNTAILAHELSHASGFMTSKTAGKIYALSAGLSTGRSGGIGRHYAKALGAYGAIRGARGEDLSTAEKVALTAHSLPMLAEETYANLRAARTLKRIGGLRSIRKGLPTLLGSQLSYTGLAALPLMPHYIMQKGRHIFNKIKDEENNTGEAK